MRYLSVCVVLPSPVAITGCELLVFTGTARVLLLAKKDMSCRVLCLLSIGSLLIIVFTLSVVVFFCAVLSSLLEIAIV